MRPDPLLLEQVLRDSGLSYRVTPSAYVFTCPKCHGKDKLHVRRFSLREGQVDAGHFTCFSGTCTTERFRGPNTEYPLALLLGIPIGQARELLGGASNPKPGRTIRVPWLEDQVAKLEPPVVEHPDHHLDLADPRALPGLAYFVGRGGTKELAASYGLRWSPVDRRLIAPIEVGGRLLGWQGRSTSQTEWVDQRSGQARSRPRYVTCWGAGQGKVAPAAWIFQDRLLGASHAVVTEGYFDALAADCLGGNVAAGGKGAISAEKLRVLLGYGVRAIYSGLDPDAQERLGKLVRDVNGRVAVFDMQVPRGRDLGSYLGKDDEVRELFAAAKPATRHGIYVYMRRPTAGMATS